MCEGMARISTLVGLALGTALSVGAWAQAQTGDTLTLTPVADTYVVSSQPTTHFDTDVYLRVDGNSVRISYLRFAVAGVGGRPVHQARLRLDVRRGGEDTGGTIHLISDNSWDPALVTYDDRPAVDGPGLHTLGAVAAGDIVEFNLDGAITGDGIYSLAIDMTSPDGVYYRSSETSSGQPPELVLTLGDTGPPPPGNTDPVVTITAPHDGAPALSGEPVVLHATATDVEDGDLSSDIVWTSDLDGPLGIGASISPVLSPGSHILTASVTDTAGSSSTHQITIDVTAAPPNSTDLLTFSPAGDTYVLEKAPDANLSHEEVLRVDISSERITYMRFVVAGVGDRPVESARLRLEVFNGSDTGGSVHVISDSSWDASTVTYASRPAVDGPAIDTLGPIDPGDIVEFNLDGAIPGDGIYNLAIDTTSNDGAHYYSSRTTNHEPPALILTVGSTSPPPPGNADPVVTITAPPDGITVVDGDPLAFHASAIDAEDGDLSGDIVWTSNLAGNLGTGPTINPILGLGTHTVTAAITDTAGASASQHVTVTVSPAPTETLTFAPAADTYVLEKEPDANFSTAEELRIDVRSERITYLRFVVTGVGGRPVHRARLRLGIFNGGDTGGSVHLISDNTWEAATVTYATRPAVDGPAVDTLGLVNPGDVVEYVLDGAISGDGVYNLALDTTSTDGIHFFSSRATTGPTPELVISVPAGPEPTIQILQPIDGAVFFDGDQITFQGQATDTEDGDLSATVQWESDMDGFLGAGAIVLQALQLGRHIIIASVIDSDGLTTSSDIVVTVTPPPPPNTEPLVTIMTPLAGAVFPAGQSIVFSGSATDLEDGDVGASLQWISDRDGLIGTGEHVVVSDLTVGPHRVVATVVDSGGLPAEAERLITVEPTDGRVGFEDFSFGSGVDANGNRATASKPESKLWYNDGIWWATLFNPAAGGGHRIHALDPFTQTWIDTGVLVDERKSSRQDALWDGHKLYAVSRDGSSSENRLYRYAYDVKGATYTLDSGFPVTVPSDHTESMTIAKDSTGTLWVAYTKSRKVHVNRTLGADTEWGTPFVIPVSGTSVASDDIAAVQAMEDEIGVFWSNQSAEAFYFARHADGGSATDPAAWTLEVAARGGSVADDHFNLKSTSDGRLFVAVKTSKSGGSATLIGLLVRSPTGTWSSLHNVTEVRFGPTRPLCLLDEAAGQVYVFYSLAKSAIYYKSSDLDTIAFPDGKGTPFIESPSTTDINDPTSTKQNVDVTTGLVAVASSRGDETYWHNTIGLP